MDLETVTQKFANTDRLWDISRTNPDGREQDGEWVFYMFGLYKLCEQVMTMQLNQVALGTGSHSKLRGKVSQLQFQGTEICS